MQLVELPEEQLRVQSVSSGFICSSFLYLPFFLTAFIQLVLSCLVWMQVKVQRPGRLLVPQVGLCEA
jgi:hypothetical protein